MSILKAVFIFSLLILTLKYFAIFPFDNKSYTMAMRDEVNLLCACTSKKCLKEKWHFMQQIQNKLRVEQLTRDEKLALDQIFLQGNTCLSKFDDKATNPIYTFEEE